MSTNVERLIRQVARIDNPKAENDQAPGHKARRLIDGHESAFTDPFLLTSRQPDAFTSLSVDGLGFEDFWLICIPSSLR